MRKMARVAAVVMVVAGLVMAQSAVFAAPARGTAVVSERTMGSGLVFEFLRFFGITLGNPGGRTISPGNDGRTQRGDGISKGSRSQPGTGVTPDGAIWGCRGVRCR